MKRLHVVFKVLQVIWDQLNKEINFLKDTRQRNVMKNINSIKKKKNLTEAERQLFSLKGHQVSLQIQPCGKGFSFLKMQNILYLIL